MKQLFQEVLLRISGLGVFLISYHASLKQSPKQSPSSRFTYVIKDCVTSDSGRTVFFRRGGGVGGGGQFSGVGSLRELLKGCPVRR